MCFSMRALVCVFKGASFKFVCTHRKVRRGRRHDWWQWGVVAIARITPHSTLRLTHTGSPMGHSDTVQIKRETNGCVAWWNERECVCVCVVYIYFCLAFAC